MKQIASFTVNHDVLKKGFYISRIDGDIATYDIRMAIPNSGAYLTNPAIHTFEHLFATYVRNSALTDSIVYVGPMGCRTGFYSLITRHNASAGARPVPRYAGVHLHVRRAHTGSAVLARVRQLAGARSARGARSGYRHEARA